MTSPHSIEPVNKKTSLLSMNQQKEVHNNIKEEEEEEKEETEEFRRNNMSPTLLHTLFEINAPRRPHSCMETLCVSWLFSCTGFFTDGNNNNNQTLTYLDCILNRDIQHIPKGAHLDGVRIDFATGTVDIQPSRCQNTVYSVSLSSCCCC